MENQKEFTNKQLKLIILDLYKSNNIVLDDNLKKQLEQSSKIQYNKLLKIYNEIKEYIKQNISHTTNDNVNDNIEIIKKEIEIQTDIINEDDKNKEIINLKTELFNMKQKIADYKFKVMNYKKVIKEINNKKVEYNITSSDDEEIKDKRKINYHHLTELSSYNIICELKKLNQHQLKQVYNKYFSSKLARKLD